MGNLRDILIQRATGGQQPQQQGIGEMISPKPAGNYATMGAQNPYVGQIGQK